MAIMGDNGWIKLHRQILNSPSWLSEPFSRPQAWIDMLLLASHKTHVVRIRGIPITVERGQLALSEVEAARRWKWSRGKVRRFLTELGSKSVQRIEQQKNNVCTVVTILNYSKYQADSTANGTPSSTANGQQTDTYKKGKKGKNVKKSLVGGAPTGENQSVSPKIRKRNPLIDALASLECDNLNEVTQRSWQKHGTALADIKGVCPDVTPDEIKRRATNYRTHFPKATVTSMAISMHWGLCAKPKSPNGGQRAGRQGGGISILKEGNESKGGE